MSQEDRMRRIVSRTGGVDLECFSHGQGVPIVLPPGGGLAVGYLSDLADALSAAGFRAVRVNPRGAGGSTGPWTVSRCTTWSATLPM
jgi:pimeloyl-ACP methyl ester carboxylesterase